MEFVEKLSAPDQAQGHVFGHYVALTAGDDGVMYGLVGAPFVDAGAAEDVGAAYVFTMQNGVVTQSQKLMASDGARDDRFGYSVGLTYSQGTLYALAGAPRADCGAQPDCGAAYLFTDSGAGWTEQKLSAQDADEDDLFGHSVALIGIESGACTQRSVHGVTTI